MTPSALPSTNSVLPPPRSTTSTGSSPREGRTLPAPAKDSAASSSPVITSGSTPSRSRMPSTKTCRLLASRVAEVATKRTAFGAVLADQCRVVAGSRRRCAPAPRGPVRPVASTPWPSRHAHSHRQPVRTSREPVCAVSCSLCRRRRSAGGSSWCRSRWRRPGSLDSLRRRAGGSAPAPAGAGGCLSPAARAAAGHAHLRQALRSSGG